ncbi:MAG: O-antigen ligase family protein, partial [Chloroflexia bacterium]
MRRAGRAAGVCALALIGAAAGFAAVRYGLAVPLGAVAGLAFLTLGFLDPEVGLLSALAIATLLPFGVLPFRIGLTPSFLELVLLGMLGGWALAPWTREGRRYRFAPLDLGAWLFLGLIVFALCLGLGRGIDATRVHNVGKLFLAVLAYFGAKQVADRPERVRRYLAVLLVCAGIAAALGIGLHALPDTVAHAALTRLGVIGYPTTGRVLRYVEDDPHGLERAIGTSVDPNAFGGMLAFAASVALAELLEPRSPVLPRGMLGIVLVWLLGGV